MAIAENGPGGNHKGKLGNVVYYMLNGKNVSRLIGKTTKPPTLLQLESRLATKMCSAVLSRLKGFINTGFSVAAIKTKDNAFNEATKANKKNIIKGIYPDLEIAYDRLQVSTGPLMPAQNWLVTPTEIGLQYSWDTDPEMPWPEATDQVMMLAYFPTEEKVYFNLFGNSRLSGSDVLEIPPSMQGKYMETYISFIAANRKQLADSTYTGYFNPETAETLNS
ncbi:DUF6266 family protein [Pedobacter heparinus]|uniref:Uncharacterized protein n=1 Tax=Pedobacter heparinus (strain ATCC 13125 / DSM 2366 / CIP 104194 / JCM 7457 / NBRC 12017 / NCIMB 9290 / NRRL B-14731 / HIM 762-3) TaxID=485917 RepID=C6XYT1_PEDHD|nr:DUF6266 family protein [Pedobacter heparinus]ACU04563.1 hypothetical protein Phep_2359 [Pedobacter heparinus DSM 2366]